MGVSVAVEDRCVVSGHVGEIEGSVVDGRIGHYCLRAATVLGGERRRCGFEWLGVEVGFFLSSGKSESTVARVGVVIVVVMLGLAGWWLWCAAGRREITLVVLGHHVPVVVEETVFLLEFCYIGWNRCLRARQRCAITGWSLLTGQERVRACWHRLMLINAQVRVPALVGATLRTGTRLRARLRTRVAA